MPQNPSQTTANRILAHISPDDLRLPQPHLEAVDVPLRQRLESRDKRINRVYFIGSGCSGRLDTVRLLTM